MFMFMPISSFIGYTLTELFRKPDNWQQIYKQTSSTFYTSNDVSKRRWEEKLLGRHKKVAKWLSNYFKKMQTQPPEVFYKQDVTVAKKQCSQDKQENTCVRVSF